MSDGNGTVEMTEQAATWSMELLQEQLAELEMAIFNDGWARLGQQFESEFSREAIGQIAYLARLYYLKNPLIRRSVNVQAFYVFGQGVTIMHPDKTVRAVVEQWLADAGNQAELTRNQAMLTKERLLQLTGNIFFALFTTPQGRVQVRSIPLGEIMEIVCDPDDARRPWFYKRAWTRMVMNAQGTLAQETLTAWYPDWRYDPKEKPGQFGEAAVRWETPLYHLRAGGLDDMQFGVAEVYPQIDWAQAYKEFLEDWATLSRAYSRFAHKLSVQGGGARGVAAAKSKLGTTFASAGSAGGETNPPPLVGSTFVAGQGVDLTTMRIGGANVSAEDGRRLLLMVAAGAGLPETFYGDASVGTVATAKSLDRPTELQMRSRQTLWADVFRDLLSFVIRKAVQAGTLSGTVTEDIDGTPTVTLAGDVASEATVQFPPLLEHDVEEQVGSIVLAATLDGKLPAGTMDEKTLVRLLLTALGVDDVQAVLDALAAEGEPSPQPGKGEGEPSPQPGESEDEPSPQPGKSEDEPSPQPSPRGRGRQSPEGEEAQSESLMVDAVRELRDALRRIVEGEAL